MPIPPFYQKLGRTLGASALAGLTFSLGCAVTAQVPANTANLPPPLPGMVPLQSSSTSLATMGDGSVLGVTDSAVYLLRGGTLYALDPKSLKTTAKTNLWGPDFPPGPIGGAAALRPPAPAANLVK